MSVLGLARDIRSNITLCLQEFPGATPSGTLSGKGLYLTVNPSSRPNTDTVYRVQCDCSVQCGALHSDTSGGGGQGEDGEGAVG